MNPEINPACEVHSAHKLGPLDMTIEQRTALRDHKPGALEAFFEAFFDPLYQYILRMVGRSHLAEDLTQDVFMQIHKSFDRYDPQRNLKPWVYTIATNRVRDFWRSRRNQQSGKEEELGDTLGRERLPDDRPGPAHVLDSKEMGGAVDAAIEALPETLRTTFVLRFHEGLSFVEIAKIVGRNEVAVRKRYSRALEELRTSLAHLDPMGQGFRVEGAE
ncbi:MAG: RNA polymerase sigma factor [bacterium]|nr:RNA polymerase sigma factor [bacterium]